MAYSEWQLNRLRNALRAFHKYGRDSDGKPYNWKDVSEAIAVQFDIDDAPVSDERLRQFVEGRGKRAGKRLYGNLQPESLEWVKKFVIARQFLIPEELKEPEPAPHAAQRLLEYLDQSFDRMRILPPITFEGTYEARWEGEFEFQVLEITLQEPSPEGMMRVTMSDDRYEPDAKHKYDKWTPEDRRVRANNHTVYGGWAIFTPEDNVMVFLKETDTEKNLYQFTLAADTAYSPESAVERLLLLQHAYPIELENTNSSEDSLIQSVVGKTKENIRIFRRII